MMKWSKELFLFPSFYSWTKIWGNRISSSPICWDLDISLKKSRLVCYSWTFRRELTLTPKSKWTIPNWNLASFNSIPCWMPCLSYIFHHPKISKNCWLDSLLTANPYNCSSEETKAEQHWSFSMIIYTTAFWNSPRWKHFSSSICYSRTENKESISTHEHI